MAKAILKTQARPHPRRAILQEAANMIYKIEFTYKDPASGQTYKLKGIKAGDNPGEAEYYFRRQYPRHKINITSITTI